MVLSVVLAPALDHVKRLSSSDVYDRRDNPVAPDSCLMVRRAQPWRVMEIDLHMDLVRSEYCQAVLQTFLNYFGTETSAEFCVANMFTGVPGSWMRRYDC